MRPCSQTIELGRVAPLIGVTKPVAPEDYLRFLLDRHRLSLKKWQGAVGLREAISQLQGFEMPAGV